MIIIKYIASEDFTIPSFFRPRLSPISQQALLSTRGPQSDTSATLGQWIAAG